MEAIAAYAHAAAPSDEYDEYFDDGEEPDEDFLRWLDEAVGQAQNPSHSGVDKGKGREIVDAADGDIEMEM